MLANVLLAEDAPSIADMITVLSEGRLLRLLLNSVIIGFGASVLAVVIGMPIGLFLSRTNIPSRKFLQIAVLTPLIIPPYIAALTWTSLLGNQSALNQFLMDVFTLQSPPLSVYGHLGTIFVLGFVYFPFVVLLTQSGLTSIDRRLEEASLLSRGSLGTLCRITLPLLRPFVLASAVFVFILSISNYGVPSLLRVNVYPVEIFIQFSAYYQEHMAVVLALPLLAVTLTLIFVMKRLLGQRSYVVLSSGHRSPGRHDLGRWKYPCLIAVVSILTVSPVLPVLSLMAQAGAWSAIWLAVKTAQMQIIHSVFLAASAATLATALGFVLSYLIERKHTVVSRLADLFSMVPFAFPAVILGIGLILVWNRVFLEAVYTSNAIIVVGYIAITIPFTVRIISAGLKQMDISLEEMVLISSGSWWTRVRNVVLPLCRPSLAIAWCICFLLCMYELGLTLLVAPPGTSTLSIRIYTLLHYGTGQLVSALSLVLIIAGLIPVVSLLWVSRYRRGWALFA